MYLFGASGHCKVIIDIIQKSDLDVIECVFDDDPIMDHIYNIPVLKTEKSDFFLNKSLIISIGNNKIRQKLVNKISTNYQIAIHPNSIIARDVTIEEGSVIMAGVILNPDSKVGKHCIVNSGAIIEHDCILNDFVHISPNAALAGNVIIGEGTHIGIGAVVIQGVKIGKWVTIGAGAVILNDIPDYAVIVGNPGKIIKYNLNE
jgi:sugar O-acyltransferase (sialic acid O-acetyltransferase NeuD family)